MQVVIQGLQLWLSVLSREGRESSFAPPMAHLLSKFAMTSTQYFRLDDANFQQEYLMMRSYVWNC